MRKLLVFIAFVAFIGWAFGNAAVSNVKASHAQAAERAKF